jgi:hypothetical protein
MIVSVSGSTMTLAPISIQPGADRTGDDDGCASSAAGTSTHDAAAAGGAAT